MTALLPSSEAFDPKLSIHRALGAVREHLGMDVAYLSEFDGENSVFRSVDAPGLEHLVKPGDVRDLDTVYCRHILEGRLPELIPDTSLEPIAVDMPITQAVPIGAHMSIPVRLRDGSLYGMFCCLSAKPNPSLNARDLATMRMFSELAAERLSDDRERDLEHENRVAAVCAWLEPDAFDLAFQPICDLESGHPRGFEALARFPGEPYRPPNEWFDDAEKVGLQVELERAAVSQALRLRHLLPKGAYVSLNASPATVMDDGFRTAVLAHSRDQTSSLVLEITEHAVVDDYVAMREALAPLRRAGMRLAVDDAGAGYASLSHIIRLQPDIMKLDMSLVRDIDTDAARHALAAAMVAFAKETGISVVAEGIETATERSALSALGVAFGQGYLLGRPAIPDRKVRAA